MEIYQVGIPLIKVDPEGGNVRCPYIGGGQGRFSLGGLTEDEDQSLIQVFLQEVQETFSKKDVREERRGDFRDVYRGNHWQDSFLAGHTGQKTGFPFSRSDRSAPLYHKFRWNQHFFS